MSERYILRIINPAEEAPNKQDIRLLGTQSVDKSLRGSWTQRTKIDPLDYFQGRGAAVGDDLTLAAVVSSLEIPSPWSSSV